MNTSSQPTASERVSETTQPGMTIAAHLRSNLKLYRRTPMRGGHLTMSEATLKTGLSLTELRSRIESGDLDACHQLCVSSADLEEEILAYQRREFARLIEDATGEAPTDETMVRMFGPQFAAQEVSA